MPAAELASWAVTLRPAAGGPGADAIDAGLRGARVPVIGRIADGRVWLDLRTIAGGEVPDVAAAVRSLGVAAL
jgi:L-seryl-tRNA(Ser) seleniumtransferase